MTSRTNSILSLSMIVIGITGIIIDMVFYSVLQNPEVIMFALGAMLTIGIVLVWANDSMDKTTSKALKRC